MCWQKRLNLTKTVRKLPINDQLERTGHYIHDDRQLDIKYDELPEVCLRAATLINIAVTAYWLFAIIFADCWHCKGGCCMPSSV